MNVMSGLSPRALALLQKGRAGLRPAPGERERIEAMLDARLAAGTPIAAAATRPLLTSGWRIAVLGALGVAAVGGSTILAMRSSAPKPMASVSAIAIVQPAPPSSNAPAVPIEPVVAEEASPPSPLTIPEPTPSAPRTRDSLAQEVALLSRATSALRAGRGDEALKVLDEHQRKFPNGALSVERRAARGQALCSLKRIAEGRAELARLAPQSPAAGRTKQVCDAAAVASNGR